MTLRDVRPSRCGCWSLVLQEKDSPAERKVTLFSMKVASNGGRHHTERKRAEERLRSSEDKFKHFFEHSLIGISITQSDGRMQPNQALCDMLGYTAQELQQLTWKAVTHPEDVELTEREIKALYSGAQDSARFTKRFLHKNGAVVWTDIYSTLRRDATGQPLYLMTNALDITERKLAALTIQQANAELERRVAERTAELQDANADLAARTTQLQGMASALTLAEHRERQRVSGVLHDSLQQLLIAARCRLETLLDDPNTAKRQTVAAIEDLITQSISCSRTLIGELSPPVLKERGLLPAMEWLAGWMKDKFGLTVNYSTDATALPNTESLTILLFQSVRELLLNIVKHAQVKTASVEVRSQDDRLIIQISDQGLGFDATRMQRGKERGTGLGLPSIRERLEILGGELKVKSAPGQGCRCTLTVPVLPADAGKKPDSAPAPKAHATAKVARAVRKARLLLVDDHAVVRESFAQLFNNEKDMEIVGLASSGEEAVAKARLLKPDIVMMDVSMKGMGGVEATKRIHAELPQVRVIGLSMFEESGIAESMRLAGAVDYLTKSSPAKVLLATIRAVARAAPVPTGLSGRRVHSAGTKPS